MPAAAAPLTRQSINEKIVALAWKDDAFRKAFLADPKGQFEEKLGRKLPAHLSSSPTPRTRTTSSSSFPRSRTQR